MFSGQDVTYNLSPGGGKEQLNLLMSVPVPVPKGTLESNLMARGLLMFRIIVSLPLKIALIVRFFPPWKK